MTDVFCLVIVEANHTDNEFYTLGGAGFETREAQQANLATIPQFQHNCDSDDRCYILDVTGPDGWSIESDREISAETAMELLGVDSLDDLRENAKADNELGSAVAMAVPTGGRS